MFQEIVQDLMSVFHNLTDSYKSRIAAAMVIIDTEPTYQRLLPFALSSWYEPSNAVHQYVYTALEYLATAKLPVDPQV